MTTTKPSKKFWIISTIAVLWNLMGIFAFMGQAFVSSAMLAELPADQAELIRNTPQWLTGIFAIATVTGLLGSILLVLRRKSATTLFFISAVGVLIQMGYSFFATDALQVYGIVEGLVMPLIVILSAVYLYFFSVKSSKKGHLN
ncbi:hypothetical protein [Leeuwenhoekiella marinoflava]|uniref:Sugar transporter n=2 Tax=Leeuwenhoekiella marinoflava TaxID=988 RepID=A0A4Q0PCL0_9FLAO|nr:hypothetical protein [Leeuwenhoekiella marinoflava]RXG24106.1 hypothetical protein DSL99_3748 [Leeuwenhoekiella marinoflava]SHF97868.1 hypothetical protein SAMN02745246_03887 [Leeuwenhoekiella marinoflava DSM 3653]